jgi:hypothetical protein
MLTTYLPVGSLYYVSNTRSTGIPRTKTLSSIYMLSAGHAFCVGFLSGRFVKLFLPFFPCMCGKWSVALSPPSSTVYYRLKPSTHKAWFTLRRQTLVSSSLPCSMLHEMYVISFLFLLLLSFLPRAIHNTSSPSSFLPTM